MILARLADAERELAAIAGLKGGRVRLASFPSAGATLVTEAVSLYRQRYPDVELSLTEGEPHDYRSPAEARRLRRRGRVRGLRTAPAASCSTGLDCMHLLDDPLCVVLPVRPPAGRAQGDPARQTSRASRGSPAAAAASATTC